MNVLSLFSGIGGIDLGLERAGMTIAGQVEIDPWCRKILAKHWPEVPRHDDVRTAAGWWGSRPVDLVAGGFPCQPVSVAGKKLAQADDRWLWPAFAQVVRDLGPRFVLVENVPGLLGRGMGDVLGDLASLGYDAEWDCIPAAFVGAPHVRRRVFVVAYPASTQPEKEPEGDQSPQHGADDRASGRTGERGAAEGTGQPRCGTGVMAQVLAYPENDRARRRQQQSEGGEGPRHVADSCGRRRRPQEVFLRPGWHGPFNGGRWLPEPDVGRVAHGIPARVDRLRGLGNAVVPQVAEHIGRLIMATLEAADA